MSFDLIQTFRAPNAMTYRRIFRQLRSALRGRIPSPILPMPPGQARPVG